VSGLITLLLRVYSGRTPDEIVASIRWLKDLGLLEALSTIAATASPRWRARSANSPRCSAPRDAAASASRCSSRRCSRHPPSTPRSCLCGSPIAA
jgi:hypothetical protein